MNTKFVDLICERFFLFMVVALIVIIVATLLGQAVKNNYLEILNVLSTIN
jgi:hypothetical protein